MITTGVRTPLGIKVFGDNLDEVVRLALEIEKALFGMEGVMSVYAERSTGATFSPVYGYTT